MKTSDILETVYGPGAGDSYHTRLADIADSLIKSHEERESRRMAAAEVRDEMAHYGPLIDQVAQALTHQQSQQLTDSRLPAVLAFDAYCTMKDASKESPSDRGLKQASYALYELWNRDPLGHLTVGELVTYRDHFVDMFPKSAAKQVFDEAIPAVGFNTLTNLPYLTRIASEVVDQESYETAMRDYGLDGDRPEQIRARGYIKGVAELALSDSSFTIEPPTLQGAAELALERVAQEMFGGPDKAPEGPEEFEEEESTEGPEMVVDETESDGMGGEEEFEETEEMATIDSPISGEPISVELKSKKDEHAEGMEPEEEDEESAPMGGPLPGSFEQKAQLQMQSPNMNPTGMDPPEMGEGGGEHEVDVGMDTEETMTTIVDPTSGQELQMTLSPIKDEPEMGEPEDVGESLKDELDEMGGGMPKDEEAGKIAAKKAKGKGERGFDEAMNTNVPTQQGCMTGDHSETDAQNFFSQNTKKKDKKEKKSAAEDKLSPEMKKRIEQNSKSPYLEKLTEEEKNGLKPFVSKDKKEKKGQAQRLSREQVFSVCASLGLSPSSIEEQLLDGNEIATGSYAIRIGSADEVELRRMVYSDSTKDAKLIRSASLTDFDGVISDFMALTAAQFTPAQETKAPQKTAKAKLEKTDSYVVTSDVPQGAPINARRMMASVWKILPDADGELMDDGRLAVYVPAAAERDINRMARVLADVFGVANIESQKLAKTAQALPSPYNGRPPIARQPAGAPAKPMQAPMQTPATGSGAQVDFIARHTDPMKQAEVDCGACMAGEDHDEHMKHAQLDEEMPPEGDDMPPEGDPALEGEPMAEESMPGADPLAGGMGGGMSGGMGGGMPPMSGMGDPMAGGPGGMPGMGGGGAPDGSQVPVDINMGQLMPEDQQVVDASMMHFRNMGMGLDEALDKALNAYAGLLDKYGDKNSVQRNMAVAGLIAALGRAYAHPSVVPAKKASAPKQAEMPHPRPPAQRPGQVTVKKDWHMGNVPQVTVPTQPGPMQGTYSDKGHMDQGDSSSHSWGGNQKPGKPQKGSQHDQTGESWPSTEVFVGTDGSGDGAIGKKMDSLSKKAPNTPQSKSTGKGKKEAAENLSPLPLIVKFDAELGDFHLLKGDKPLEIHASLNMAVTAAERRAIGTDARILIEDGQGGYEDAVTGELVVL